VVTKRRSTGEMLVHSNALALPIVG